MAHPAYGTMPHTPRNAGAGGFIPPPPGASQGGEPNPYSHPSPYIWSNNAPLPSQPQQYSSYPHASALAGGPTRSARSNSLSRPPAVPIPQQIQSQRSYPYQFQPQNQAYWAQQPPAPGQTWNLGPYPSSFPTTSQFPIGSITPTGGFNRYSPYSAQQSYSNQFSQQQLPAEDEAQVPFIPPDPDARSSIPFGGAAHAPPPLKSALKRSSSQSAANQPSGSRPRSISRRRSSSGGPEISGRNQEVRVKKVVRSDSRGPEIIGDQNEGFYGRSNSRVRPRSGSGGEMINQDQGGGSQAHLSVVTRARSGSGGPEMLGSSSENRGRSRKKTTKSDKAGSGRANPVVPPPVTATTSTAPNVSPTSPSASPTSPSTVPAYAQEDDNQYDANNLSGRPKDWRPDYCPTLGTSLYLKLSRARSESEAYEDNVKRSINSLLEWTPHSPPLALDLRYKVKGKNGAILSQRVVRAFNNEDKVDYSQPALVPHVSRIRLVHPKLPWYVDIHQSDPSGVTVSDVLVQLSSQMRTPIRGRHYYNDSLSDNARAALGQRYGTRTEGRQAERSKGVTQVDFLGEKFVMEGLVRGNKGLWEIKTRKK